MGRGLDIGIAGCGVAGLAVGALLARAGHRVVAFDQWESPSPLGSGVIIQPVGLVVLDAMEAGDALRALGAPLRRLYGKSEPSGRVVLDVRYAALGADAPNGLGMHRAALFQVLFDAALNAGVRIENGVRIVDAHDGRFVFAHGRESTRFDLLLDCLGMRSPLCAKPAEPLAFGALWANVDAHMDFAEDALEQRYERARKMAGVLPIGRVTADGAQQAAFFWSLKGEAFDTWRAHGLEAWKDEALSLWPRLAPVLGQITSAEQLIFARYAHRTLVSPLARHVVHVGDSWHCASPQLGQGANMALLDALALSRALESQSDLEIALKEYQRMRLWHIRLYQLASYLFTPAYQSDSAALAWLRDRIMAPISRTWPAPQVLAALVAGQLGAPLGIMGRFGNALS
jgi:2-polyprenyl-6-methoxyphenol hydroxylase-like FAD-dependent oxidoreductase